MRRSPPDRALYDQVARGLLLAGRKMVGQLHEDVDHVNTDGQSADKRQPKVPVTTERRPPDNLENRMFRGSPDACQTFQRNFETRTCQSLCNRMRRRSF
jgi:hypothetical protein